MYQIENKRAIHITVTVWQIAHGIPFSCLYTRRIYYKWLTDCDSTLCNSSNDVNQIKRNDRPPTTSPCYGHTTAIQLGCSAWHRRVTTMKCLALQRLLKFSINNNENLFSMRFIQWKYTSVLRVWVGMSLSQCARLLCEDRHCDQRAFASLIHKCARRVICTTDFGSSMVNRTTECVRRKLCVVLLFAVLLLFLLSIYSLNVGRYSLHM